MSNLVNLAANTGVAEGWAINLSPRVNYVPQTDGRKVTGSVVVLTRPPMAGIH